MIRSLLEKTLYELLNGKNPKLTYLRTFGCKCFILNNGGEGSHNKEDKDREFTNAPGEATDIANGKTNLMSQVKQSDEEYAEEFPKETEEPGPFITSTEVEHRVADTTSGTSDAAQRSESHNSIDVNDVSNMEEHGPSNYEVQVSNWKQKSSHHLQNVITPLDSSIQPRSKARNMFSFSSFISQIEPKNIKKSLKDTNWIAVMQEELHQFERSIVWHLVPRPLDRTVIRIRWVFRNKLDKFGNTTRNKANLKRHYD
ncbi:uncharacterized protein [Nicotiana tomentosiformis]|uniref:uncharacterized protein n=1 Tax=Nicotiana tomentosiformis TaxID=4098 RepID=UPI00388CBAD1